MKNNGIFKDISVGPAPSANMKWKSNPELLLVDSSKLSSFYSPSLNFL